MIYVILPAYNEEKSFDNLFPKLKDVMEANKYTYKILLVDDGSVDGSHAVVKKYLNNLPLEVINHKMNRGLWETVRDGFERAAELCGPDDVIIRMDCDDTHDPKYIPDLIAKINEGYDVVITSRFQPESKVYGLNWYRSSISRAANLLMKSIFPIKGIWEYSCGYRAYRGGLVKDAIKIFGNEFIDLRGVGFTCTLEKLIKFRMMGAKMIEIPFTLRYDQKASASKMVSSITTLGYIILILKYIYPWGKTGRKWKKDIQKFHPTKAVN